MKKFFAYCLVLLASVVSFTSCEKSVEPDPTAPGRMIFQQTRQHLMTPVTVLDLAIAFNEYYMAPTDKMRDEVEDKYFADYKIRYDEVSQMWRLERSNNPVVRIKMEEGKSLSEMGGKWHFYPGRTDFSGDSAISVEYKAAGVYVVNFNKINAFNVYDNLLLSGSLEMTPSNRTVVNVRGNFNFSSTEELYKVAFRPTRRDSLSAPLRIGRLSRRAAGLISDAIPPKASGVLRCRARQQTSSTSTRSPTTSGASPTQPPTAINIWATATPRDKN